ncbi:hypothetical protein D9613_009131 [Agrocybe pediades]|uniref:Alanine dehydrogenase/pyridine nucleotide transhydrogenase N-terminal domain-containing protein n=1 Tax=Agrocybe pediades TaxID=84607 RepID=A0A8H4VVP5_9AGAR|nr:hypothetical protein D9613_009131 [Agrocybe pediades]
MSYPKNRVVPPSLRWTKQARKSNLKVGIRAEDPARIWERRAPLTPDAVYDLVSSGKAQVEVASSSKRIFSDTEYVKAGARIVPSLTDPDIIVGIKEPPISELTRPLTKKAKAPTHLMFSHTAKGQPYNMPLLSTFLTNNSQPDESYPRLVDYELLTDSRGKRTIGFGWYAGVAGVLESLASMAQSHLQLGVASPFLYTPRPHTLPNLSKLRASLREIGQTIATHGTPSELGPFIFGLTGTGQVAEGCLSMLQELPIQMVQVSELESLISGWRSSDVDLRKIYLVHAKPEDYLVRTDGGTYNRDRYYQSPQSYQSVFCDRIAPYLTLLLNGTGWSPSFPRLMTTTQLAIAQMKAQAHGGARCTNIGDISCDVEGGLEFMRQATTLSSPFYIERPANHPAHLPGVQIMSVDILPASIPHDASVHFSSKLAEYMRELVDYYNSTAYMNAFPVPLERATIAAEGQLRPKHQWLGRLVQEFRTMGKVVSSPAVAGGKTVDAGQTCAPERVEKKEKKEELVAKHEKPKEAGMLRKKRILMLGSGMVAGPAVDMIARSPDVELVIASDSSAELQQLSAPHYNVQIRIIDASKPNTYAPLIADSDVVMSLLPAAMHVDVAKLCIRYKKHLVTASYTSKQMQELDPEAKSSGVLLLNEIGLDPGIDHCSAMDMIHSLTKDGKIIESFTSFCGGLPCPEDSHVPLGYKFSWRPQGVLTAAMNEAKFLLNHRRIEVPGDRLLQSYFPSLPISPDLALEGLPNRNSYDYLKRYIPPGMKQRTFVRGTLRYPGFSSLMSSFRSLGLLNNHPKSKMELSSWEAFVVECMARLGSAGIGNRNRSGGAGGIRDALSDLIPKKDLDDLRVALEWLGLAKSDTMQTAAGASAMPPLPVGEHTPLDLFAYLLSQKLRYAKGERDMVVLAHEIITRSKSPSSSSSSSSDSGLWKTEVHTSTLISTATTTHDVGYPGERPASAMARTVGMPIAIAALLVAGSPSTLSQSAKKFKIGDFGLGVQIPTMRGLYRPILDSLRDVGIRMEEKTRVLLPRGVDRTVTVEDALVGAVEKPEGGGLGFGLGLTRGVPLHATSKNGNAWEPEADMGLDLDADRNWREEQARL